MATAKDFGVAQNWVITPDGRWIYGRVDETNLSPGNTISPTPPPVGTPYWTAGSAGDWKMNTYTGDSIVTDYIAPNVPSTTSFKDANPNLYPPPTILTPNQPPPGGWTPTTTYNDIFGKTAPAPPGAVVPQRPGTVPGSVWNNPDSAAPRGYNPELWAQREIGPNRTYAGGITGLGIGGPRNADGTAMYAPPPEYKPTRGIDPFGYEPAPRKQAEFSGFTIGDDGFYRSDRGGSGAAYDENLLRTLKAAADAGEGRANYILSSLSTGADMTRPVFSAKMNQYGANPIDNYAAQYDWEQEVLQKKDIARKVKQGWTFDEDRMLVPPDGWIQEDNGSWRPPEDAGWTNIGGRWFPPERNSTKQSAAPTPPGWTSIGGRYSPKQSPAPTPPNEQNKEESDMPKNPFMPRMAGGTVVPPGPRAAQEILRAQAQRARDVNGIGGLAPTPGPRAAQEILRAAAQRQMDAANPFLSSLADSTRRMPVHTMPSERVPTPMQRGPAVPGRLPIQTPAGTHLLTFLAQTPAPNPFLSGGATRGYRNPFR